MSAAIWIHLWQLGKLHNGLMSRNYINLSRVLLIRRVTTLWSQFGLRFQRISSLAWREQIKDKTNYLFYFIYFIICTRSTRNIMSTLHHTKLQVDGPSGHCRDGLDTLRVKGGRSSLLHVRLMSIMESSIYWHNFKIRDEKFKFKFKFWCRRKNEKNWNIYLKEKTYMFKRWEEE